MRPAVQVEDAHLVRAADDVAHKKVTGVEIQIRRLLLRPARHDRNIGLRHQNRRIPKSHRRKWRLQLQDLAVGGILAADGIDRTIGAERGIDDSAAIGPDLHRLAVSRQDIERPVIAVTALDHRHRGTTVKAVAEKDFGYPLQPILGAQHQRIAFPVAAQRVEIDLHVEVAISFRNRIARIARVPETLAIGGPGQAAARGGKLHMRNRFANILAGCRIENVQCAVFAAVLRQGNGNLAAIAGRYKPIDRRQPLGVKAVGVQHDMPACRIGLGIQRHQHGLLPGRIGIHRDDHTAADFQFIEAGRCRLDQIGQPRLHRAARRQRIEIGARAGVLRIAPGLNLGIVPIFEPAIGVCHLHPVDHIGNIAG